MALLEVQAISKSYPASSGAALVVDQVSFTIARGETLGVVGESGSGKSTVARIVLGLIEPTAGEVRFDGEVVARARGARLRWMRRRMQPVFQDPYAALNPRMRVEQILCEPFRIHSALAGSEAHLPRGRKAQRERIAELLKSVGLDDSALRVIRMSFQAVSASASTSRVRWRCGRSCWCWISRSPHLT